MPTVAVPRHLADELIGRGRHFVTTGQVAELLDIEPSSVRSSLRRSIEAGAMLAITKDTVTHLSYISRLSDPRDQTSESGSAQ